MTTHLLANLSTTVPLLVSPPGTHSGADITIQNVNADGYVYIGSSDVTTSSYGFRLSPSQAFSVELNGNDSLYLVSSQNNLKAAILTVSLEAGA